MQLLPAVARRSPWRAFLSRRAGNAPSPSPCAAFAVRSFFRLGNSSPPLAGPANSGCRLGVQDLLRPTLFAASGARCINTAVAGQKQVRIWLFTCTGWVFSLVLLGGVTRLTRSGLSMTDWRFTGSLPPLSPQQWHLEFEKYQQSPEYKRVNQGMTLEQFKFIYWMEYGHRMWGRGLGLLFAFPFAYFGLKGYLSGHLASRLCLLFGMGAGQGFVGWWMVKSGLEEPKSEYVQPRVSPYRLAVHLTSAFAIYSGLLWTALSVGESEAVIANAHGMRVNRKLWTLLLPVAALVGLTAVSGAFVAGNDAGHAFNTFPKMGDRWIPDDILVLRPLMRNFFENTSTVQLDHRILATSTLVAVSSVWFMTRNLPVNPRVRLLLNSALVMTCAQVTLGVSTLLTYVPVSLGSLHQAGALTLFSIFIALLNAVKQPRALARMAPLMVR